MIFQTGSSVTLEKRDEFIIIVFLRQFASLLRVVDMIAAFSVRKNQSAEINTRIIEMLLAL